MYIVQGVIIYLIYLIYYTQLWHCHKWHRLTSTLVLPTMLYDITYIIIYNGYMWHILCVIHFATHTYINHKSNLSASKHTFKYNEKVCLNLDAIFKMNFNVSTEQQQQQKTNHQN